LSGESFWAAVTAVKKTDPTGEIYFDGVLMDITERKEAEEALRASEARFRGLLEAAPDGVVVSDHEGRIVLVNAQTESLLGYEREELLGESVEVLVPDRVRGGHREDRERYMRDPNKRMMGEGKRLWARRCDGGEVPVSISLSPVHTDGGLLVFSAIRDITEIHQAEERIQSLNEQLARHNRELESVNKELEAFSYSVSHDLRAPLRAIDGFSRILQNELKDVLDPQSSDRMMRIRRAAQRMGELIDDMLKLSRVTRAEMSWQDVDLATLAGEVMDGLRHGDPEREVVFESVPALPVRGDPQLLRIVLENLLGNAWKFTSHRDAGHIELGCEERDGERVIRVRDNGAGFDMSYADKLFGAFQRLHDAREFPGTGIGLATVQRIVPWIAVRASISRWHGSREHERQDRSSRRGQRGRRGADALRPGEQQDRESRRRGARWGTGSRLPVRDGGACWTRRGRTAGRRPARSKTAEGGWAGGASAYSGR